MKAWQPLLLALAFFLPLRSTGAKKHNKLLILSLDGFRWDYIGKYDTPNFDYLKEEGLYAPLGVKAAFVTKTFPNHYTLVTGLYEESHGIVNNRMYDPLFNATFSPGNTETRWWDGGQPIWITARLQNLTSAVYFWPGSETKLSGVHANHFVPYNKSTPFEDRVKKVVKWLKEEHTDVALAYFHEPDGAGHRSGAFSKEVKEAVLKMDDLLGYTIKKMKKEGLWKNTNLLVVSDHGMTNISSDNEHQIILSDYLDMETEVSMVPQDGAVAMVLPREGKLETVYTKLKNSGRRMTVYKKEDIPEHFHYKQHRRIMPIVIIADEGYTIKQFKPDGSKPAAMGGHGYDNDLASMRPIFFARGPNFKRKKTIAEFETVNVYELCCHLLGIQSAPNNGSLSIFESVLKNSSPNLMTVSSLVFVIGTLASMLI